MKTKIILGIGLLVYATPALAGSWSDASNAASLNELKTRLYAAEERATWAEREAELEASTYDNYPHEDTMSATGHWPSEDVDAWLRMVKINEQRREEQRTMNAKWEALMRRAKDQNR